MSISEPSRSALESIPKKETGGVARWAMENLADDAKEEVADAFGFMPKNDAFRTILWLVLLIGLFIIAGFALWGGIASEDASASAPLYLIATAVVSGTLGLFAKSPVTK